MLFDCELLILCDKGLCLVDGGWWIVDWSGEIGRSAGGYACGRSFSSWMNLRCMNVYVGRNRVRVRAILVGLKIGLNVL